MSIARRILLALLIVAVVAFGAAVVMYETIPRGNTQQSTFDAIIVLGYPANPDGSPSLIQRERVLEAVREYRASVAPRLIMTGARRITRKSKPLSWPGSPKKKAFRQLLSSWNRRRTTRFKTLSILFESCRRTIGIRRKWSALPVTCRARA
jgi:hypothetical protein